MMHEYQMLSIEELKTFDLDALAKKYNQAIEEIWHLQQRNRKLHDEIDMWMTAYEEVADKLYG